MVIRGNTVSPRGLIGSESYRALRCPCHAGVDRQDTGYFCDISFKRRRTYLIQWMVLAMPACHDCRRQSSVDQAETDLPHSVDGLGYAGLPRFQNGTRSPMLASRVARWSPEAASLQADKRGGGHQREPWLALLLRGATRHRRKARVG